MDLAVVLGGGGPVGIAWETGILLGLRDEGVDLAQATAILGTSAGAIVGANLAVNPDLERFYRQQFEPFEGEELKPPDMSDFFGAWTRAKLFSRGKDGLRRSLGKSAASSNVPGVDEWLAGIGRRLPGDSWPGPEGPDLRITAIDIADGMQVVWNRDSGVPLREAVAASCTLPCVFPLVTVNGRRYMDGGMGSPTNALLAREFPRILVLDPLGRVPGMGSVLKEEMVALAEAGCRAEAVMPDDATTARLGMDLMDPSKTGPIAELGRAHGRRLAGLAIFEAVQA